jgi:hypothetical protein
LITLIRDTFTDDGFAGRGCFDRTPLTPGVEVDIDVDIQEVEIRVVSTSSAVISGDITDPSTLSSIAAAILSAATTTPIAANMKKTNDQTLIGDGTESDKFRSILVP